MEYETYYEACGDSYQQKKTYMSLREGAERRDPQKEYGLKDELLE